MNDLKLRVTKEVQDKRPHLANYNEDALCNYFFMQPSSLRLTYHGHINLSAVFDSYEFVVDMKHNHLITLSRSMKFPYYLTRDKIILFSETDAMMINLCGGIEKFLENNV